MFGKKFFGSRLLFIGFISLLVGVGCQNYRFEPYDESNPMPTPNMESVRSKVAEGSSSIQNFSDLYTDTVQAGAKEGAIASGMISLDPLLLGKVDSSYTLYIIARNFGKDQPPVPLAVQKFKGVQFPLHYQLTQRDIMIQDMEVGDLVWVDVLYDKDGDPMTKDDLGAIGSFAKNPIKPGSGDVDIVLKPTGG